MTFVCDGCGEETEVYGVVFRMALDHLPDQPSHPIEAEDTKGHLCPECRDTFNERVLRP